MAQETREISKEVAQTPTETERYARNRKVYVPKVDIYETKDSMVVIADMPGVDESSVDLTLRHPDHQRRSRPGFHGWIQPGIYGV